mgnify:CR=1 FL=1
MLFARRGSPTVGMSKTSKPHSILTWALALLGAAGLGGCSTAHTMNRIDFPEATINGHPAHLALDTGASMTLISGSKARALGIETEYTAPGATTSMGHMSFSLSAPVHFTLGASNFTASMVVGDSPKEVSMDDVDGMEVDGVVGWPEIWNNILFFDGAQRKVAVESEVPIEAVSWQRFRLHRSLQLAMEIPLANGDTGVVLVDTGSYVGVGLPPAQWKAWQAAHPGAATAALMYYTPGVGTVVTTEAWADEVKLGSLTLTDVPVHEANPAEMKVDAGHYAGTLGLYALSRMDMVLDGPHGAAFVKPLPPPGPFYSAFRRAGIADDTATSPTHGDWTIEGPVKLDLDNLLDYSSNMMVQAGNSANNAGDTKAAFADYAKAIAIFPKNTDAYIRRGLVYESENDFTSAIADYTQAMGTLPPGAGAYQRLILQGRCDELAGNVGAALENFSKAIATNPKDPEAFFMRGVDKQAQGDLPGAADDYDQAVSLQTENVASPVIYLEVLRRWIGSPKADLSAAVANWADPWSKNAGNYLDGKMSEKDFLAAAGDGDHPNVTECQTYYLVGMNHFINGDKAGAREFLQKCLATNQQSLAEYRFAKATMKQLGL